MYKMREAENKRTAKIELLEHMKLIMEMIIKDGGACSTWMIADMLKIETKAARVIMLKMKNKGIIEKHIFSSKNNTVWQLANKD